ncbi:MAG: CCA tRNA nucleotidyltransferase [Moorellales bacterium]
MLHGLPEEVKWAAEVLRTAGHQAFLVGGALRDGLLGLIPKDWDLATDALPQEVMTLFGAHGRRVLPTGLRFGTVSVLFERLRLEITTFRAEGRYRDYRRPDYVRFGASVVEDLARRDFTVNALALDLGTGRLVDPFGGRRDLEARRIRTVGRPAERFQEDPLRMLRGFRLAAVRGFSLDGSVCLAAATHGELLQRVARERVREELTRLLTGSWAAPVLRDLARTGLVFILVPELKPAWSFPQTYPSSSRTLFEHLVETVRYTPPCAALRLAAFLHDLAKPYCFSPGPDGSVRFYGHDRLGAELVGTILGRLRWDHRTGENVTLLVRHHMFPLMMGDKGIRRLVLRVGPEKVEHLLALRQADLLATGPEAAVRSEPALAQFRTRLRRILDKGEALSVRDLAVDGHDVMRLLGIGPGPEVGRILRQLHEEVLADPGRNHRAYLETRILELSGRNKLPAGE